MTAVSSAAAAGVRSCAGLVLELEVEQSEALGMLYGFLRTCWTRRGDQMVTGAASTASSEMAEVRPWWETGLRRGNEGEKRGKRWRSSPRLQRQSKWARGRTDAAGASMGIHGGRRWKRRRRRLHGASGGARLDGELQGGGAELPRVSGRRGEAGGYGDARRRRRWFSGEREREQGEKRRARESESGAGQLRGFVRGIEGVRGSRRWPAGGEVARARAG